MATLSVSPLSGLRRAFANLRLGTEVQEHVMNELTEACKQANAMQNSERRLIDPYGDGD